MRRVPAEDFESLSDDGTADGHGQLRHLPSRVLADADTDWDSTHRVVLKVGVPFMLLRTINPSTGLFNGTRCLLITASPLVLHVEIVTGLNARHRGPLPYDVNSLRVRASFHSSSPGGIFRIRHVLP